MPKKMRVFLVIGLFLILLLSAAACSNTNNTKDQSEQKQAAENNQAQGNPSQGEAAKEETQQTEPPRRGCAACHVKTQDKDYSLLAEAKSRAEGHPTTAPDGTKMDENTTVETCLLCHAPGTNGRGKTAPLALRTIVHPAHLFSTHFVQNYSGNCFTCHEVDNTGTFNLLSQKVETNEKGVPQKTPIPGMIPPSENPAKTGS